MGVVARYIEKLSDEQRDNIIEAEAFNNAQYFDAHGVGCLVGVAEREYFAHHGFDAVCPPVAFSLTVFGGGVGGHFDTLCRKFGKARIVAACKNRAARGNNISREAQRAEKDGRVQTQTGVAHADRVGCPSALGEIRSEVYRELVPVGGMNGRYPEDLR